MVAHYFNICIMSHGVAHTFGGSITLFIKVTIISLLQKYFEILSLIQRFPTKGVPHGPLRNIHRHYLLSLMSGKWWETMFLNILQFTGQTLPQRRIQQRMSNSAETEESRF